jgi:diamine N-acetyltransferase
MIDYFTPAPQHGPALADMARRSFTETFGHLYDPADLDAFLETAFGPETGLPAQISDPSIRILCARANGAIIGFCKLGPPSLPVPDPRPDAIELRQLYILKEWHGRGVAQALMDWALGQARGGGASEMYLSVFVDNHRAQRFYARYGFEDVGPYSFMVGNHADEDRLYRLRL